MNIELLKRNIRRQRKSLGITQEEMARKLGISRQAYNNIEQGKTHMVSKTLPKIADHLCVSVDHLLLGYDPVPNASSLRQELREKDEKLAYSERERREMQIRMTDMQELISQQSAHIESLKKIEKYQTDQLEKLLSDNSL